MKKTVYLLISLLLVLCNGLYAKHSDDKATLPPGDSLTVISAPGLLNLSLKWAEEYNARFPGANIKVIGASDQNGATELIKQGNLGFVSSEFFGTGTDESIWRTVVGRDVLVAVVNAKNPFIEEIDVHGVSPDVLASLLKKGNPLTWGDLLGNGKSDRASYFCINDESAVRSLAQFLGTDEAAAGGRNMGNPEDVISAVQLDPYSFGFCKLINVIGFENQAMPENLRLLPLDKNGNGQIDFNEMIYEDLSAFTRGVWIGKYPRSLINNIYTVASAQPENVGEVAFLKWVLTEGQKYLSGNGYSDLLLSERQSATDRLTNARISAGASSGERNIFRPALFISLIVVLAGLFAVSVSRQRRRGKSAVRNASTAGRPVLDENSLIFPKGIYFDKTHTWAFLEESGTVRVGIDDFLQHVTGKITRISMKGEGKRVKKGEQILSIIQNGKHLNLYAPVSGTIVGQNAALLDNSSPVNSSPYKDGWIYRIEPSNWSRESQLLFMSEKHREFLKLEFSRLKDFLMNALRDDEKYAQVLLQDGGEISDGVLSEMGPEIWEDFQTGFIDPSRQVWFYEMF